MKRQRLPVAALDPTRPLLFHQQSLASVTGCKQPYQLIFPDQTTSIGLPIESELRNSFADFSSASPVRRAESEDSLVTQGEAIIIVCTPASQPTNLNPEMAVFVVIVFLQIVVLCLWSVHVPTSVYLIFLLHACFLVCVAFQISDLISVYQALLAMTTALSLGEISGFLMTVLVLNAPILAVSVWTEKKLTTQTLISSE